MRNVWHKHTSMFSIFDDVYVFTVCMYIMHNANVNEIYN